jgi:hypothetical protein
MPLQIRYPSIAVGDDKDYSSLASHFQWDPFESQNDETRVALWCQFLTYILRNG